MLVMYQIDPLNQQQKSTKQTFKLETSSAYKFSSLSSNQQDKIYIWTLEITQRTNIQKLYIFNLTTFKFVFTGFQTYNTVDHFAVKKDILCIYNKEQNTIVFYNIQTLQQLYKLQCQEQVNKISMTKTWQKYDFIVINQTTIHFVQDDFSIKEIKPQEEQLFLSKHLSNVIINYIDVYEGQKYVYILNQDGKTFLYEKMPQLNILKWQNINEKVEIAQCTVIDEDQNLQLIGFTNSIIKANESVKLNYYGKVKISEIIEQISKCSIVYVDKVQCRDQHFIITVNEKCQASFFILQWNNDIEKKKINGINVLCNIMLPQIEFDNILQVEDQFIYYKQNNKLLQYSTQYFYSRLLNEEQHEVFAYHNNVYYEINNKVQIPAQNTDLIDIKQYQLILYDLQTRTPLAVANISNDQIYKIVVKDQFILLFDSQHIYICRWKAGLLDMVKQIDANKQQQSLFLRFCYQSFETLYYVYDQELIQIDNNDIKSLVNFNKEQIQQSQIIDIVVQKNQIYICLQINPSLIQILEYNLQLNDIINIFDIPVIPETTINLRIYKTQQKCLLIFVSASVIKYYNLINKQFQNSQYEYTVDSIEIDDNIFIKKQDSIDLYIQQQIQYTIQNDAYDWLQQSKALELSLDDEESENDNQILLQQSQSKSQIIEVEEALHKSQELTFSQEQKQQITIKSSTTDLKEQVVKSSDDEKQQETQEQKQINIQFNQNNKPQINQNKENNLQQDPELSLLQEDTSQNVTSTQESIKQQQQDELKENVQYSQIYVTQRANTFHQQPIHQSLAQSQVLSNQSFVSIIQDVIRTKVVKQESKQNNSQVEQSIKQNNLQEQSICTAIKQADKELQQQLESIEDLSQEQIDNMRPQVKRQLNLLNNTIQRIQKIFEIDEVDMQKQINELQRTLLDMTLERK